MFDLIQALENVFKSLQQITTYRDDHPDANPQYLKESAAQLESAARGLTVAITEVATNGSKAKEEIAQSEAEMMVEHKDGTVEYVKDIDNIMLLADKNYQIGYTGRF